jgi:succinate dehydrogenase / fumarate reductase flavoprotein subunit
MEVGPTCHYVMGGIEVDPDTQQTRIEGLYAVGECSGGMHGSNRLGGNSLSDLLVFGRRAGLYAAEYVDALGGDTPSVSEAEIEATVEEALAPLANTDGENPYTLHHDLQVTMNELVGIIRKPEEVRQALDKLAEFRPRHRKVGAAGGRRFNPGWHVALDLRNMLLVSECVAKAALEREESRGGHTRDDFPGMSPTWRKVNLICALNGDGSVDLVHQPIPTIRPDLLGLFDKSELTKYFTDEELAVLDEAEPAGAEAPVTQSVAETAESASPEETVAVTETEEVAEIPEQAASEQGGGEETEAATVGEAEVGAVTETDTEANDVVAEEKK